jgi:hypothetical protein
MANWQKTLWFTGYGIWFMILGLRLASAYFASVNQKT